MKLLTRSLLSAVISPFLLAVSVTSQTMPEPGAKSGVEQTGFTWTEAYEGSGNTDGFITDIDSTVGYVFGKHFAMDMGVPYFFISRETTGSTSDSTTT